MLKRVYRAVRAEHGAGWRCGMAETRLQWVHAVECGVEVLRRCLLSGEELCPYARGWRRLVWLEGYYSGLNQSIKEWLNTQRLKQLH